MGMLIIDHSGLDKKPGTKYGLNEFQTTNCVHCQGLIVHFTRGCTEYAISQVDVLEAFLRAGDLPSELTQATGCSKCRQLLCWYCAERMEKFGCPGPWEARQERAAQ